MSITQAEIRAAIDAYEDVTGDRLPDGDGEDQRIMRAVLEAAEKANPGKPLKIVGYYCEEHRCYLGRDRDAALTYCSSRGFKQPSPMFVEEETA